MIQAFAEAIRATIQPCTLLLLLPPLVMAMVTRGRWLPFAATCVGSVAGGWLFLANIVGLSDHQLQLTGLGVAVVVGVLIAGAHISGLTWAHTLPAQTAAAGLVAFVSTLWWRPCVGTELGVILSGSRNGLVPQLPGMAAYMLGAMIPVLAVTLIFRAVDPSPAVADRTAGVAGAGGLVIAVAMALGRHDQLVETLTRWTRN
jgi:cytochrome c biogenesis protein CcdA